jgi:hypothetical protein
MISIHLFRQKKDVVEPFNLNVNEELQCIDIYKAVIKI